MDDPDVKLFILWRDNERGNWSPGKLLFAVGNSRMVN